MMNHNDSVMLNYKTGDVSATGKISKAWGQAAVGIVCLVVGGQVKNPAAKCILMVCGVVFLGAALLTSVKA